MCNRTKARTKHHTVVHFKGTSGSFKLLEYEFLVWVTHMARSKAYRCSSSLPLPLIGFGGRRMLWVGLAPIIVLTTDRMSEWWAQSWSMVNRSHSFLLHHDRFRPPAVGASWAMLNGWEQAGGETNTASLMVSRGKLMPADSLRNKTCFNTHNPQF